MWKYVHIFYVNLPFTKRNSCDRSAHCVIFNCRSYAVVQCKPGLAHCWYQMFPVDKACRVLTAVLVRSSRNWVHIRDQIIKTTQLFLNVKTHMEFYWQSVYDLQIAKELSVSTRKIKTLKSITRSFNLSNMMTCTKRNNLTPYMQFAVFRLVFGMK